MKYIVKESEWYRGKGSESSYLLKDSGLKCCLGFVGEQCDISKRKLRYNCEPYDTVMNNGFFSKITKDKWPKWFFNIFDGSTNDVHELMYINDNKFMSDHERKKKIREIFKKHGDKIVFVK